MFTKEGIFLRTAETALRGRFDSGLGCEGVEQLHERVAQLDAWAFQKSQELRKEVSIQHTSTLVPVRVNPHTSKREVLLVRGGGKSFWQFPGGHVEPEEGVVEALIREMHEEIGITLQSTEFSYIGTYCPKEEVGGASWVLLRRSDG